MERPGSASHVLASMALLATLAPWAAASVAGTRPPAETPALATYEVSLAAAPDERLLDGTIEAVHEATLAAQTGGRVTALPFDVDDRVGAGGVLVRIHSTEQVAGLGQARAALTEATAREAEAQARYGRIDDMYQRRVVAKAQYDEARAARDAAVARLEAARAALAAASEGVSYTEVRAPFAGVVTQRHVQVGETVAPGAPLVAVAAPDALRVVVEVPQSIAGQVRAVRTAVVYVDGQAIAAAGVTVFPSAQPQSGTFRARIDLPPGAPGLAPGLFAKVGLVTGQSERLAVPRGAVVERSEMRAVYVVADDGGVSLRQVRLGRVTGDRVEILAGLVAGERVALDPAAAGLRARATAAPRD
jgi:membrane fusion protein, multidrug efflux system